MNIKISAFTLALFLCLNTLVSAQNPAGKTFTKAFNTEGKGTIRLELPGIVDLKIWDSPSIRCEISAVLPGTNGSMLNELANIGRYNLVSKVEGDVLIITAPNLQKQLKVKGEEIKESMTYVVYVPKDLQIEMLPANTTALAEVKK